MKPRDSLPIAVVLYTLGFVSLARFHPVALIIHAISLIVAGALYLWVVIKDKSALIPAFIMFFTGITFLGILLTRELFTLSFFYYQMVEVSENTLLTLGGIMHAWMVFIAILCGLWVAGTRRNKFKRFISAFMLWVAVGFGGAWALGELIRIVKGLPITTLELWVALTGTWGMAFGLPLLLYPAIIALVGRFLKIGK